MRFESGLPYQSLSWDRLIAHNRWRFAAGDEPIRDEERRIAKHDGVDIDFTAAGHDGLDRTRGLLGFHPHVKTVSGRQFTRGFQIAVAGIEVAWRSSSVASCPLRRDDSW